MNRSMDELSAELVRRGIRLSHPRLKVLEYLVKNRIHPTVDRIYTDLLPQLPSLSKTTVYNTLKLLQNAGLVRVLNLDETEARYDIAADAHGHFQCDACGRVFDFDADIDGIASQDLDGFLVAERTLQFKGRCPDCLRKTP